MKEFYIPFFTLQYCGPQLAATAMINLKKEWTSPPPVLALPHRPDKAEEEPVGALINLLSLITGVGTEGILWGVAGFVGAWICWQVCWKIFEAEEKEVLFVRKWDAVVSRWAALDVAGGGL